MVEIANPCCTAAEALGRWRAKPATMDDFDQLFGGRDVDLRDDSGDLVALLRTGVIASAARQAAAAAFGHVDGLERPSLTRRAAAGLVSKERFDQWRDDVDRVDPVTSTVGHLVLKDGRRLRQPMSNPVRSYMAGFGYQRFRKEAVPALLTRRHPDRWRACLPVFQQVSEALRSHVPTVWRRHAERCARHPAWTIPGTVFSTVAVNLDYESCYHHDTGDFEDGLSTVTAIPVDGDYEGGFLVLPRHRVAFDLQPGDVVFFQAHEHLHGNTPVSGAGRRLSFVTYLKKQLVHAANAREPC